MPGKHLFEYAVIRVVPRVEREEFINVGVVLYCKNLKYLKVQLKVDEKKLKGLCDGIDCSELEEHLQSYQKIAAGDHTSGPIAVLDMPSRFRWLTATRSTIVQSSKVHPGFCTDPDEMLNKLFCEQVL